MTVDNQDVPVNNSSEHENNARCYICHRNACEAKGLGTFAYYSYVTINYDVCRDCWNAVFIRMAGSSSATERRLILEKVRRDGYMASYNDDEV